MRKNFCIFCFLLHPVLRWRIAGSKCLKTGSGTGLLNIEKQRLISSNSPFRLSTERRERAIIVLLCGVDLDAFVFYGISRLGEHIQVRFETSWRIEGILRLHYFCYVVPHCSECSL